MKGALKFLGAMALLLAIAGGILYALYVKVVDVGHNGMAPTLVLDDRVLVWETESFELGDVVLCAHPGQEGRFVMGRIVGRPGHTISMERGTLRIDGEAPDTDVRGAVRFEDRELGRTYTMRWAMERILDDGHTIGWREGEQPRMSRPARVSSGYYLLSDNRTHRGEDSRAFGEVDPARCVGQVFMRLEAGPSPDELGHDMLDIIR